MAGPGAGGHRDAKELTGTTFHPQDPGSALVSALVGQVVGDTGLSPARIASAHHISLRYLHRLFEAEQVTVGAWIRGRRLEHCRRDLADPRHSARSVSAISAGWGLPDATHFAPVSCTPSRDEIVASR